MGPDGASAYKSTGPGELLDEMTLHVENVEVRTKAEQVRYGEALSRIEELADARNARLVEAGEGIPTVLWGVLAVGGGLVVGFAYLFGLESTLVHNLMVGAFSLAHLLGALYYWRPGVPFLRRRSS